MGDYGEYYAEDSEEEAADPQFTQNYPPGAMFKQA